MKRHNKKSAEKSWMPKSPEGKKAVKFAVLAVAWGILMPFIPFPDEWRGLWVGGIIGASRVLLEFIFCIVAGNYLFKAWFKAKDRAILLEMVLVLFVLVAGFWTLFIISEFLYPH